HEVTFGQLLKRLLYFHRQWRRTADAGIDGLNAIFAYAAKTIDCHIHARRPWKDCWAISADGFQYIQNLKLRLQDQRRADRHGNVQAGGQAITMKERYYT